MRNRTRVLIVIMSYYLTTTMTAGEARCQIRPTGRAFVTRSVAVGKNGMAATSQPLATLAALDTLRAGGNAVDAAIAADAVLGVTEPTGAGIGGDLFAIVWDAETQKLYGLNASGRSPKGLTLEEFQKRELKFVPKFGPLPVSVPGCVDGWAELHGKFGKLPLNVVLGPAIRAARDGYPVTEVIAGSWAGGIADRKDQPGFTELFMPGGRAQRWARSSTTRRWRRRWRRSPAADAMSSTRARSPARSTPS